MTLMLPNRRETEIMQILTHGERYGAQIRKEYQRITGEPMPLGSLYTTLLRMVLKGYLKSRTGKPIAARGGIPRKYFRIQAEGRRALALVEKRSATLRRGGVNA